MRDWLGSSGDPGSALPADEQVAAFSSNAVSPVSRLSVESSRTIAGLFDQNQARGFGEGIRVALETLLQSPSFL